MSNQEKSYCLNCGNTNHCGEQLTRKEVEIVAEKIVHEWTIEVCRQCICSECEKHV